MAEKRNPLTGYIHACFHGISKIPQPSSARPYFDASGNTYYLSGQPTAGAAQTQYGGDERLGRYGKRQRFPKDFWVRRDTGARLQP